MLFIDAIMVKGRDEQAPPLPDRHVSSVADLKRMTARRGGCAAAAALPRFSSTRFWRSPCPATVPSVAPVATTAASAGGLRGLDRKEQSAMFHRGLALLALG